MLLPSIYQNLLLLLSTLQLVHAADSKAADPCTIHSPVTGSFYDLRPLQLTPIDYSKSLKSQASSATNESYHVRGYDYPYNFTLNFCGPVVEAANLTDVDGISKRHYANISAYYKDRKTGETFSLGESNSEPLFRGRKLLLNYTSGSPCPDLDEDGQPILKRSSSSQQLTRKSPKLISSDEDKDEDDIFSTSSYYDDDEDERNQQPQSHRKNTKTGKAGVYKISRPSKGGSGGSTTRRRKTTLLSFICDTAPSMSSRPSISFLGSPDHCTYVFEVRSRWACGGATPSKESGTLGPGAVFAVISCIAVAVYLIGGVVYQRNVMHQRGWRQLPNYAVWAGIFGFVSDMFVILFSSCSRCVPGMGRMFGGGAKRGGYHRVGEEGRGGMNGLIGRGHHRTPEDENRLIDQLDEEWD